MKHDDLLSNMRSHPFSICIDGSNDTELEKMNPITVQIYDVTSNMVVTRFLDMCTTTGATAEAIYNMINVRLGSLLNCPNPWMLCTSVGVDNISVNIGVRDSIKTRVLMYFNGCPCHIIHNTAQKAGESFTEISGFDIEEFVIDLFYWFAKRKNGLQSYCMFCDQEGHETCVNTMAEPGDCCGAQFPSLASYFKSKDESQAGFRQISLIQ